jgi:hypothetical protein
LVSEVRVEPPPGYADYDAFLQALEATLLRLHTAGREPVNQSLRGGSQTSGGLFGRRDPVIAGLRESIARAVANATPLHCRTIPRIPSCAASRSRIRFSGSWSVRLWSAGRHVSHFHQEGWISSAYYISLPPSVLQPREGDAAGCIQFGEPPAELGLALGPRRVIRPRVGAAGAFSFLPLARHGAVSSTTPRG